MDCKKHDLLKDTWETLPSLNHAYCSRMGFVVNNQVAIFGGFKGNSDRWNNAEVLDEVSGTWNAVKLYGLPPLEGVGVLSDPRDKKDIFIFQGVTNEYESQKVWRMTEELRGSLKDKGLWRGFVRSITTQSACWEVKECSLSSLTCKKEIPYRTISIW